MNKSSESVWPVNPYSARFLQQVPVLGTILRNRRRQASAQQRIEKVLQTYKEILQDARYKIVHEDVRRALGEQLALLVEKASECHSCSRYAMQVRMLQEVILDPVDQVWYDNQRARMEDEAEEVG